MINQELLREGPRELISSLLSRPFAATCERTWPQSALAEARSMSGWARLNTHVAVDAAVTAQFRDKIDVKLVEIERTLSEDVKPSVEDFKR